MKNFAESIDYELIKELGMSSQNTNTGQYILQDDQLYFSNPLIEGLELWPISYAFEKYKWLKERTLWMDFCKKGDSKKSLTKRNGYFIYVHKNIKIPYLCQTALLMLSPVVAQSPYNIIFIDDGASLNLLKFRTLI